MYLYFEPIQFVKNLKYMGIGMLGVFVIIAIIMAATYAIMHFTSKKENPTYENEAENENEVEDENENEDDYENEEEDVDENED